MKRRLLLTVVVAAWPSFAGAQTVSGGTGRDPRPVMRSDNRNTDSPFAGGLGDFRNPGIQGTTTCLVRKSDGATVCHTRREWEAIAAKSGAKQ